MNEVVHDETGHVTPAKRARLGVLGWENPAWEGDFYPEDMPAEWRLTFFNTQFDCVYLHAAQWQQVSPETISQWADDTHERFRFLLQPGKSDQLACSPPQVLAGRALCLAEDAPSIIWFDAKTDIKALGAKLSDDMPSEVYLLSRDGDLPQIERVRILIDLMGVG